MDQKIKVMMIADVPRNLSQIKGGLEAATVNLIGAMRLLNVELHVITIRPSIVVPEVVRLDDNSFIHYYPFTVKKNKILEFLWFGNKKVRALYDRLRPDIVHMQGTGPVLLLLRGIDRRKIVITQHGIMAEELKYKISLGKKVKFFLKSLYDKLLIPRFNNYIAISEYNRKILSAYQKDNQGFFTRIIHNPVNPEFFQARPMEGGRKIVFVGLVNKLKGVHLLIEAMHLLKEDGICYALDLVGGTKEPEYLKEIEQLIVRRGLSDQVTMHGWVSQHRVKELIQENSIFLLPSLQECLPISIAEAMAAGRVVVATETGGIPEMFIDGESGFLFPRNDVEALAAVLKGLHDHPATMKKVGSMARQEAARKFEPGAVARQTVQYYHHMTHHNTLHKLISNDVA